MTSDHRSYCAGSIANLQFAPVDSLPALLESMASSTLPWLATASLLALARSLAWACPSWPTRTTMTSALIRLNRHHHHRRVGIVGAVIGVVESGIAMKHHSTAAASALRGGDLWSRGVQISYFKIN